MERNVQTPQDFLAFLQTHYSSSLFNSAPDVRMSELVHERMEEVGGEAAHPGSSLELLVQTLANDLLIVLTESEQQRVAAEVAIGLLDHPSVNAGILKGFEGFCAVVLNSGFIMALNKYLKIVHAMNSPGSVTYCNRGNPAEFGRRDYALFLAEFVEHYATERVSLGPRLLLHGQAAERVSWALHCAEQFVLCHEIGHFLNGDLEHERNLKAFAADIEQLDENVSHNQEFSADRKGFEIFLRIKGAENRRAVVEALRGVVSAFDFIYVVTGWDASEGHPAPLERGIRIAREFLGPEAENALRDSYYDPTALLKV